MSQCEDLFLSDVHAKQPKDQHETTFGCSILSVPERGKTSDKEVSVIEDDDGDLDVPRKRLSQVTIQHCQSTSLEHVGLQIWSGSILLGDYLLANPELVRDKTCLELGCGTGFCSIFAALAGAKRVIATDLHEVVLECCERNTKQQEELQANILTKRLDWGKFDNTKSWKQIVNLTCADFPASKYNMTHAGDDVESFYESSIIFGSDLIYDFELTNQLVDCLDWIIGRCRGGARKTVYLSMERRPNFSFLSLSDTAPVYEHFVDLVTDPGRSWTASELDAGAVAKSIQYQPPFSCDIRLWRLEAKATLTCQSS